MTELTWRSGRNDDAVWLQYGAFDRPEAEALLSLVRHHGVSKVELQLRLHHLDGGASRGMDIPRYARFSFGEEDKLVVEGVGFISETQDGRAAFTTGQGHHDQDLSVFQPVLETIEDRFEISVDGEPFFFPIDARSRSTLLALFR